MEDKLNSEYYTNLVKDMHETRLMGMYLASQTIGTGDTEDRIKKLAAVIDAIDGMILDGGSGIGAETLEKYRETAEQCLRALESDAGGDEREVLVSRIRTPDGTILESRHRHDFVSHTDANGEYYFLDGGCDYMRTSVNKVPAENVSIYTDSPFEEIRENVMRGTFDNDGNRIWKPIKELSDKHLENILSYNKERGADNSTFSDLVRREIEYRAANGITVEDDWDGGGE